MYIQFILFPLVLLFRIAMRFAHGMNYFFIFRTLKSACKAELCKLLSVANCSEICHAALDFDVPDLEKISLDIIFVDDAYRVVSIAKNTIPYSEAGVDSALPAKFVVEVPAGFADRHGIVPGNRIRFFRD